MSDNAPLTVVLARGAFADASSWNGVVERPQAVGIRRMAERAGATITEVEGSHVIMVSQPDAVAAVIGTRPPPSTGRPPG